MADNLSDRFALPLLHAGQAQKEMFHNEALTMLDMVVQAAVESADLAVPPVAPDAGQCWIVAAGASGAWAARAGMIAGWTAGGWRFVVPVAGMRVFVADRGHEVVRTAGAWVDEAVRGDGFYQAGARVVGPRGSAISAPSGGSVVDIEARATIAAVLSMLQTHGLIETM